MKTTIFHLENRCAKHIYHFLYLNLAGLYYIENKLYNIKGRDCYKNGSTFPILNKVVAEPSQKIIYPIKIHMNDIKQFHREAFEIIKDKFILVEDLNSLEDYEVVNIYGGLTKNEPGFDTYIIVPYIRKLFLDRITSNDSLIENIYLTRKYTTQFHDNTLKRSMLNEEDALIMLSKYNFKYIILEDLSFKEKIKLFMNAKKIISSNSGGLSFITFCNNNTDIIEIMKNGTIGFAHYHYQDISSIMNLKNYKRYDNIVEDNQGNFNININEFEQYLLQNNIVK